MFDRIAAAAGAGSAAARAQLLRELLGRGDRGEQDFLVRLLFGELRQGALEGVLVDAVGARVGHSGGAHPSRRDARRRSRAGRARRR